MDEIRSNPARSRDRALRPLHAVVARRGAGSDAAPDAVAPPPEPAIDRLQRRLNRLEYRDAAGRALPVDGVFGERTGEALVEFQRAHDLRVDGVPGLRTLAALYPTDAVAEPSRADSAGAG